MRESLTEISAQRAEQFLNTFYFQYGHRSIADLAHIAFAVERLSLLAAIVLVDEQRWDGQERSTRYQNFMKSGWYFPEFGNFDEPKQVYSDIACLRHTNAPPQLFSKPCATVFPVLKPSSRKLTSVR
jgi:thymidylate synthase ThyX